MAKQSNINQKYEAERADCVHLTIIKILLGTFS